MSSKWRKLKLALGFKLRRSVPAADRDDSTTSGPISGASLLSPASSSQFLRLTKSFSRSSTKKTCSICLAGMRPGDGHAIFTAECSHSFHFHCIASNVKYGNQVCPICRAKWKEIPFVGPAPDPSPRGRQRVISPLDNALMTVIRRMPLSPRPNQNRHVILSPSQAPEPALFNDDECLDHQPQLTTPTPIDTPKNQSSRQVKIETFPEISAVPLLSSRDNFTILIHLKAPASFTPEENPSLPHHSQTTRAAVDLVTVLDVSGSMAGTKLALLKRAMGFVIQNLGPNDRLSVIAFSSTARRLFPLQRMTETGKQQSLLAVNSLTANGGTNIAEGLRKGVKVMDDRREKNPVASIILLSDGQDTYTVTNANSAESNYHLLLPLSISENTSSASKIPVHAFGFGTDHDASAMHSVSDISGGTFSFIETEAVIQDAFAQCIGGLLSVVAKDLKVLIECAQQQSVILNFLRAGSYVNRVADDRRTGSIEVGDLYAEEERDFLVSLSIPAEVTSLLKVRCVYSDPLSKTTLTVGEEVIIQRPQVIRQEIDLSIAVDRQRNRFDAAEAMVKAKAAAEKGDLAGAATILESCRKALSKSVSAKAKDELCVALDAELNEMKERLGSRHMYEASGRAYILSGLSSHSWQRATARGDSTQYSSLLQSSYQTPSMAEMLNRSQATTLLASPSSAQRRVISPNAR